MRPPTRMSPAKCRIRPATRRDTPTAAARTAASARRPIRSTRTTARRSRRGSTCFVAGYYWEAHEAWEAVLERRGTTWSGRGFPEGLIKLAAAGVKVYEGLPERSPRTRRRPRDLFEETRGGQRQNAVRPPGFWPCCRLCDHFFGESPPAMPVRRGAARRPVESRGLSATITSTKRRCCGTHSSRRHRRRTFLDELSAFRHQLPKQAKESIPEHGRPRSRWQRIADFG